MDKEFRNTYNIPGVEPVARKSPEVFSLQLSVNALFMVIPGWEPRGEESFLNLFCLAISTSIYKELEEKARLEARSQDHCCLETQRTGRALLSSWVEVSA